MDLGIAGKTALVTAASKGLGFASAMALAEAGAKLVICARGEEALLAAETRLIDVVVMVYDHYGRVVNTGDGAMDLGQAVLRHKNSSYGRSDSEPFGGFAGRASSEGSLPAPLMAAIMTTACREWFRRRRSAN